MNRRDMLMGCGAAAFAAMLPFRRARRAFADVSTVKRNLIIVLAQGGWDTSVALDPKAPPEVDVVTGAPRLYGNLDIFVDDTARPNVTAFFDAYADQTAVVRGIKLASVSHPACVKRILTGARSETSPDVAAMVAHELGRDLPIPYLVLGPTAFTGPFAASSARVGATNQIVGLLDDPYPIAGVPALHSPSTDDAAAIRAYTVARAERERAVRGAAGYNARRVDDFVASLGRGDQLKGLADRFGNRGRTMTFENQRLLAIEAIKTGISHAVMLSSGLAWDTHDNNDADQTTNHETLFTELKFLLDQLAIEPGKTTGNTMLDETVVAVISEMSRTPQRNNAAIPGKDHWPVTSAMVIGSGVAGGRAYGASTAAMESALIDFATGDVSPSGRTLEPKHLAAGLLSLCGVDPSVHLPDAEVFDAFQA
jgi:hypothetical protein